jgi:hypothetical protein
MHISKLAYIRHTDIGPRLQIAHFRRLYIDYDRSDLESSSNCNCDTRLTRANVDDVT